uniref:Translocator protein n=1 Tax=Malurus cyaneus samueli TaxID=2593467 RepID=A0A8C5UB08_9PASS
MWAYTVGFTVLPHVGGFLGWFLNRKEIPAWYEKLKKPSWCPSRKMFPVAWTVLYTGMGYASYLVWNDLGGCSSRAIVPLGLYGAQLALNWAWPPFFFGARNLNLVMGAGITVFPNWNHCVPKLESSCSRAGITMAGITVLPAGHRVGRITTCSRVELPCSPIERNHVSRAWMYYRCSRAWNPRVLKG